jgi:hypothetical protein
LHTIYTSTLDLGDRDGDGGCGCYFGHFGVSWFRGDFFSRNSRERDKLVKFRSEAAVRLLVRALRVWVPIVGHAKTGVHRRFTELFRGRYFMTRDDVR